jgi:hypothetical protein
MRPNKFEKFFFKSSINRRFKEFCRNIGAISRAFGGNFKLSKHGAKEVSSGKYNSIRRLEDPVKKRGLKSLKIRDVGEKTRVHEAATRRFRPSEKRGLR